MHYMYRHWKRKMTILFSTIEYCSTVFLLLLQTILNMPYVNKDAAIYVIIHNYYIQMLS